MPATFLASTTNILSRLLELHGHDPARLFRDAGLENEKVQEPGVRLDFGINNLLWEKAVERVDDPCFGLRAAECWHPSDLNALGYTWLASSSLRTALQRLSRYSRMVSEGVEISLKESSAGLEVALSYHVFAQGFTARNRATMSIILDMCRLNYGAKLNPVSVTFTHDQPKIACRTRYEEHFSCPVQFNSPADSFTLSAHETDKLLASSNPNISRLTDQLIISYMAELDSSNIEQQVQKAIIDQLPSGGASKATVAHALKMSVRSLDRKLQGLGVCYRTLLDKTREELAKAYLDGKKTSMTEISFLLGFSESSAFSRAFRRWTGRSPFSVLHK